MSKDPIAVPDDNFLSFDDIIQARDREYVDVRMPEWPAKNGKAGIIRLRSLTNGEVIEYTEALAKDPEKKRRGNIEIVVRSAVKSDNVTPMFTPGQAEALMEKSAKAFLRLARAALKINGLSDPEEKAVEAKNE